jgi:alkanesulfonate monooxygenase
MPVEFLGIAATNDGSEITARSGPSFDKDYTLRLARAHEEHGWDRVLFAYGSGSPDPSVAAAYIASQTDVLQLLLAHRPNVAYPTFAAKTFATIDQISGGRVTVHFITGGTDHEQQREGDYLSHDERYARTREYMAIVKQAWTAREPFDHDGPHYKFADFVSDVFPVQQPRPGLSFGGSSPAAYQAGGAEADIYCLWGEPLASTAEQIGAVKAAARAAGRRQFQRPGRHARNRRAGHPRLRRPGGGHHLHARLRPARRRHRCRPPRHPDRPGGGRQERRGRRITGPGPPAGAPAVASADEATHKEGRAE